MERTGYYDSLMALVGADWLNREKVLQTEASKKHSRGLGATLKAFREIADSRDIEIVTRAEALTVLRERDLYGKNDPSVLSSLNTAVADFAVIASALAIVLEPEKYRSAAATYHSKKRLHGIPVDGFHEAANSHITRLGNRVRVVGISMPDKDILRQRQANMRIAKELYMGLQRKALGLE